MTSTPPDSWAEQLADLLVGSGDALSDALDFQSRVSAGYTSLTPPGVAAEDLAELATLFAEKDEPTPSGGESAGQPDVFGGRHRLVVRDSQSDTCTFRLRRYGLRRIALTSFLPMLESFGLLVVESIPYRVQSGRAGEPESFIDDIGVRTETPSGPEASRFVPAVHGPRLVEALEALARGDTDVDGLNRLVTLAGLDWRQVTVLRAYLRYRLQVGSAGSSTGHALRDLLEPLAKYPDVARALIGYFISRFDPALSLPEGEARGAFDRAMCMAELDSVNGLEDDRALRGYLGLIDATLRTNYFRTDTFLPAPGGPEPTRTVRRPLVLKFDSGRVPGLPQPKPNVELFVHSTRVEGIHLRAGPIARGGLRWSERPDDLRTEVLDLAFAQVKKNAIIVPTGAKGGFVCRRGDAPAGTSPKIGQDQVRACYEEFVTGLLDVTDNIVNEVVVTPPQVLALDGPDPYLVVAADKGTATFSDVANSISESIGFWLGDAFASGGSRGYDHKAMGITARGAWVAVRRHFRELGIDVQSDPVQVVGVGDMSGDVFGNGMLQSRAIRLVAAFDHRHIFLDPDPDPDRSYEERTRLAGLGPSTWADYRPEAISEGGGVWSREVKSVPLSAPIRRVLAVGEESLSPPELISAILAAPVDLLWFGGVGTFVKAPDEPDTAVGDHANDTVRVTSDQVRARVIAEGANLGVTQKARIRYSRRGGRINADFIDNAAGVATSDREVNLKILLALAIETGELEPARRDEYLQLSEPEVAEEVLRQVDHSVAALNRAAQPGGSAREIDAYEALIDSLESAGRINREVEVLPGPEEIAARREAGAGLIRPELAVVLAYAKSDLVSALERSAIVEDPGLLDSVVGYFPQEVRAGFGDLIPRHRLYRQLVATDVAGEVVDRLGIVWANETAAETGRGPQEVTAAFWAARAVTGADILWPDLDSRSGELSFEAESALHSVVARSVADLARAYVIRPSRPGIGETVVGDLALAETLSHRPRDLKGPEIDELIELGVAEDVAASFHAASLRAGVAKVGPVVRGTARSVDEVIEAIDRLEAVAGIGSLAATIEGSLLASPVPGRFRAWQARALLDDLAGWTREAAMAALSTDAEASADRAVGDWLEPRSVALSQATALSRSAHAASSDPLAVASLCVRRLQALLGS